MGGGAGLQAGMFELFEASFNGGVAVDRAQSFFVGDAAGRHRDHSAADKGFAAKAKLAFFTDDDYFNRATHNLDSRPGTPA